MLIEDSKFQKKIVGDEFSSGQLSSGDFFKISSKYSEVRDLLKVQLTWNLHSVLVHILPDRTRSRALRTL